MVNAGKHPDYQTREWRVHQRKRVFDRDGGRCRRCGVFGKGYGGTATLTMQHLVPQRVLAALGRRAADHELATLCSPCHGREDGGRRYS